MSRAAFKRFTVQRASTSVVALHDQLQSLAIEQVPVETLHRSTFQPRLEVERDEQLEALAASIKAHGVLQPLVARALANGEQELLAGERRLEAAKIAGLAKVPVRVLHDISDAYAQGIALTENLSRADLQPWERALGLYKLQQLAQVNGNDVDVRSLARIAGVGKTTAAELIRIAERLGGEVLTELEAQGGSDGLLKLSKAKLLHAAEPDSVASRCERLLGSLGRRRSRRAVSPFAVKGGPTTGMTIRLSRPVSRLRSREAKELLDLVTPLVTALKVHTE